MINPFNKQTILWLRNLDSYNKCVGLVLIYIIEYPLVNTT